MVLNRYEILNGFYAGTVYRYPGSGYIDFHNDNMLVLSTRGVLGFTKDINSGIFTQIKNNIEEFIGLEQFEATGGYNKRLYTWFSLRDLLIHKDKIYVSFTEEIKDNCFNTSVIYADMNYENIKFTKLLSTSECIHITENLDKEFVAHQSGGRMVGFDQDHILLTNGDYRSRFLAQDEKSINGKIIMIDTRSLNNYKIISIGHRNPQGLYFDEENNFILSTEHGPMGGDEINLIDLKHIDQKLNYGWPISSTGKHYCSKRAKTEKDIKSCSELYKKYPLYDSHVDYGFIEPLKSFVPSIGISEITKINNETYVLSSLNGYSLFYLI